MEKLTITEIIDNMVDELSRTVELFSDSDKAQESMLIADINNELDRVSDLKNRIDFAMLISAEIGDVSVPTIDEIYKLESENDLPYEDNGMVDTEALYNSLGNMTSELRLKLQPELGDQNTPKEFSVYDFVMLTKRDYDVYDIDYDTSVTVCYIDDPDEDDYYSKFCNNIMKKVKMVEYYNDCCFTADWNYLIKSNIREFREFSKKNWAAIFQYENDTEEFVYQWIREIDSYMAGNVSDDFYETLVEFVDTLIAL